MSINSTSGEIITLTEAKNYTRSFQDLNPNQIKAFYVGKEKLLQILSQPDCIGIRIFNGHDTNEGVDNRVLIGVDSNTDEMSEGIILEKLVPCPSFCSANSVL